MTSGTKWLSTAEQADWRAFLAGVASFSEAIERQLQDEAGMPHGYYEVLVQLSEAPDRRLRMSELADRLTSSRSRLSHAVARLEEKGWVRREPCPADRRGQLAVLTDEGFAALEEAAPGHVAAVRRHLVDALGPEDFATLGRLSRKLLAAQQVPGGSALPARG
ncbi:DNA-binding MarR family transcriptional regulator [Motilibacter rhizosphaerae]|uniref:DNA-binding MarR family transcriptional regulator n=1 Tax=Motilibacter rhizosphaerae TaxID=598652 RepID=A0A4Q7NX58_9ACTN|nr:MarR family transcriptional regulator [Motilibacter rhizosphaerae]RZS91498.1 DNA-binding MarR family transcriptional regulator [Motilibacter rhizosphaerae]